MDGINDAEQLNNFHKSILYVSCIYLLFIVIWNVCLIWYIIHVPIVKKKGRLWEIFNG